MPEQFEHAVISMLVSAQPGWSCLAHHGRSQSQCSEQDFKCRLRLLGIHLLFALRLQRGPPQRRGGTGRGASGRPAPLARAAVAKRHRRARPNEIRQGHSGRARGGFARREAAAEREAFFAAERRRTTATPRADHSRRAGVEAHDRGTECRGEHARRPDRTLTVHHGGVE